VSNLAPNNHFTLQKSADPHTRKLPTNGLQRPVFA
jgi:hypothetical protein